MILEAGKVYRVIKIMENSKPVMLRIKGSVAFAYDTIGSVPDPVSPTDLYQDTSLEEGFATTQMLEMCDWVGYTGDGYCEIKNIRLEEKQ